MGWLRHNLGYKLLALALSTLLWGYVRLSLAPQPRFLVARVEMRDVPNALVPKLDHDRAIVTVTGPREQLEAVTDQDISAWVDLKSITAGRAVRLPVNCSIDRDPDLLACSPNPAYVTVRVEDRITRLLPVKVFISGTPPLGYVYAEPAATPPAVAVTGLRRDVGRVAQLVASVAASGRDVKQTATVLPLDSHGDTIPNLDIHPGEVAVSAPLHIEPSSKQLLVNPTIMGRPAPGFRVVEIVSQPATVVVRGDVFSLSRLTRVDTRPVDIQGLSANESARIALQRIPGVQIEPDSVTVTVAIQPLPRFSAPEGNPGSSAPRATTAGTASPVPGTTAGRIGLQRAPAATRHPVRPSPSAPPALATQTPPPGGSHQ